MGTTAAHLERLSGEERRGLEARLMEVLRELGVRPGDRVATLAWNSYRHLELYFAVPCLGAILHTVNILLLHSPGAIRRVGRSRLERFDLFLYTKVPRNIRDQIFDNGKGFHRLDRHRSVQRQLA